MVSRPLPAQVSDLKREISTKYGVLSEDGVALRGLFLIDREVRLRLLLSAHPGRDPGQDHI
jgi:alkyl hydroperoxide reductase subunit AhpC